MANCVHWFQFPLPKDDMCCVYAGGLQRWGGCSHMLVGRERATPGEGLPCTVAYSSATTKAGLSFYIIVQVSAPCWLLEMAVKGHSLYPLKAHS